MAADSIAPGYRLHAGNRFCGDGDYENIVGGASSPACRIGGIDCPSCGWWSHYGVWYPTVSCMVFNDLGDENARHVGPIVGAEREDFTPETFSVFVTRVKPLLGPKRPLIPGTIFDIRPSRAIGRIGDFAWHNEATPVVRESIFQAMLDAGFAVVGAPMPYRAKRDLGEKLIHLEIPPLARLSPASGGSSCELCGKYKPGGTVVIDGVSFDASVPLQRVLEMPDLLIAAAALANFIRDREFTDVAIDPIEFG